MKEKQPQIDYLFIWKISNKTKYLILTNIILIKRLSILIFKIKKTFYRWIKSDSRWKKLKQQIKQTKRHFKRYEVSEIGLLQMDAKIITTSNFPVDKKYYIYDFIDEITRIVFGYVYDSLGTDNAINAVAKSNERFWWIWHNH